MADLSPRSWGIPVVASTAERDALFPSPSTNQRAQNLETGRVERWDGIAWVADAFSPIFDVMRYGAKADGSTDDTAAIQAAIDACVGTIGWESVTPGDSVTYTSLARVILPAGSYKTSSTISTKGVLLQGESINAVKILPTGAFTGPCIDCSSADDSHRRLAALSNINIDGTNCTAPTATRNNGAGVGIKFGRNYRSTQALDRVRVFNMPSWGLYFGGNTWLMSFNDVVVVENGLDVAGTGGIGSVRAADDPTFQLLDLEWHNLILENNGNATGYGLYLEAAHVSFLGGLVESNQGLAQMWFKNGIGISLHGMGCEHQRSGSVDIAAHSFVFEDTQASVFGGRFAAQTGSTGAALRFIGASRGLVAGVDLDADDDFGGGAILAEDTSVVTKIGATINVTLATQDTAVINDYDTVQAWQSLAPLLVNSWAEEITTGYYKTIGGVVHLKGRIGGGSVPSTAFTLPAGYRPQEPRVFAVTSNSAYGAVQVAADGTVTVAVGNTADVYLDGITFRAESA